MKIFSKIGYAITLAFFGLIWILPRPIKQLLAFVIYILVGHVIRYRRKVALTNLRNSFPEKSKKELRRIVNQYYLHLSYLVIEIIDLRLSPIKWIQNSCRVENTDEVIRLRAEKRNLYIVLGHFGNWEFGNALLQLFNYKSVAIYKKIENQIFDQLMFDMRSRLGSEPIEMHSAVRQLVKMVQEEPFAVLSVADQSPLYSETQLWIDFLNQDTNVFIGPERLSKKFDMAVVYVEIRRIGFHKFNVCVKTITDKPKETAEYEIITAYYKLLEESIRKNPSNWMWTHRRWKRRREKAPANHQNHL